MTATPIPRTLHMSLVGIRDLSLIETPPANRKILTQVLEESEQTLHMAYQAELERGGQICILHNKVKTIEAQSVPNSTNATCSPGNGTMDSKMNEDEIESTMLDFYEHRYDVLVTTIIESGIDIPNEYARLF